jgi:sporulation protein YlmC with PRC-barrel domain
VAWAAALYCRVRSTWRERKTNEKTNRRNIMRLHALLLAATGAILATSTSALAADVESLPGGEPANRARAEQCLKDLQTFDDELTRTGFGILQPDGYGTSESAGGYYIWGVEGTPRQKMRTLRDAAYIYAWSDDEQSCQMVLGSMRAVYEEHQSLVGTEADDPHVRTAWRRAHLERAKPITEMGHVMRADILIGSEIRNLKDEKLGEVDDIVLNPEQRGILYVLAVPAEAFDDAPAVDGRTFATTADAAWQRTLGEYWDSVLQK